MSGCFSAATWLGKPNSDDARGRGRLVLQAVGQLLVQPLDQRVEFRRHLADHVARLVVGLERVRPRPCARSLSVRPPKTRMKPATRSALVKSA